MWKSKSISNYLNKEYYQGQQLRCCYFRSIKKRLGKSSSAKMRIDLKGYGAIGIYLSISLFSFSHKL